MRTIEVKIYKYNELSNEAKEKAIEKLSDINIDYEWYDYDGLLDLSAKEMKSRGIKLSDKWYESNKPKDKNGNIIGEYPAYTGLIKYKIDSFDLDRAQYIQFKNIKITNEDVFRKFLRIPKELWINCYYIFNNTPNDYNTELLIEHQENKDFTKAQQIIIDRAIEIFNDKVHEAWVSLRDSYEYLQGKEAIEKTIEANEYEFTEDGKLR